MAATLGEVDANLQNENTYDLVCLGIPNESGTCYLSAVISSILTMDAIRRPFMNLPDPDSPHYCIPYDSMTALIHFFFLRRRRPKIPYYYRCLQRPGTDGERIIRIEKLMRRDLIEQFERRGGEVPLTLHYILMKLISEGYVKGLEENLSGKYTTLGKDYNKHTNEIMVNFFTNPDTLLEFIIDLRGHQGEVDEFKLHKNLENNTTKVLTIQHLIEFAQLFPNRLSKWTLPELHKKLVNNTTRVLSIHHLFKFAQLIGNQPYPEVCADKQFQTTVTHF